MVWYNYRRVPAVTLAKQSDRRRAARADLPLSRQIPAGLDDLGRSAAGRRGPLAARCERRRQRRHRRSAGPLHRHCDVAERRHRQGDGDDRDLHQGAQPYADRQGREGDDRRRQRVPRPLSAMARSPLSRRRATRAATRRSIRSRSTARRRRSCGICTICIGCNISTIATKAGCAAGARCTSPTATIPI